MKQKGFITRNILSLAVMLVFSLSAMAQQHFVYIQADNKQPFYVKYGGKNYSSSSIGYIILPKLSDGDLTLQIGFPQNLYPEQNFTISVAGKDYGYALKNFEEKGWGLFNFQTTDIVMNTNAGTSAETATKTTTTTNASNAFGNMLADAINDSSINQQSSIDTQATVKPAEPVTETAQTAIKPDSSLTLNNNATTGNNTKKDSAVTGKTNKNDIVKSSESAGNNGTDFVFLDTASNDTIRAFIPVESAKTETKPADTLSIEAKAALADSAKGKIDNPFFNNNNTTTAAAQPATEAANTDSNNANTTPAKGMTNSSCEKMFTDNDIEKLKKKIITQTDQEAILKTVKKSLRDKCISTDQVKDLGNLFLSDESRYGFYDTVYPFVYDYGNFSQLQKQLIDTYYRNRFKALLHE